MSKTVSIPQYSLSEELISSIFHFFVLGGSVLHFLSIYWTVL